MPVLTGLDRTIKYRALVPLKNRKGPELYTAMDKIFWLYNGAGFTVTGLFCDPEFHPLLEDVCDNLNIKMDCPPAQDHVPEAERNNCVIGERIQLAFH